MYPEHSHNHGEPNNPNNESWLFSRTGVATLVALSILGFLVYEGHGAHLLGALPFLLILACPLMHIFMHGGHGGHRHSHAETENSSSARQAQQGGSTQPSVDAQKKEPHKHHGGC